MEVTKDQVWWIIGNDVWLLIIKELHMFQDWCRLRRVCKYFKTFLSFEICWKYWKQKVYFGYFDEPTSFIDWLPNLKYYHRLTYRGPRCMDLTKEKEPLKIRIFGNTKKHFFYVQYEEGDGWILRAIDRQGKRFYIDKITIFYDRMVCTDHHMFYVPYHGKKLFVANNKLETEPIDLELNSGFFTIHENSIVIMNDDRYTIPIPKSLSENEFTFEKKTIPKIIEIAIVKYADHKTLILSGCDDGVSQSQYVCCNDGSMYKIAFGNTLFSSMIGDFYWVVTLVGENILLSRFDVSNPKKVTSINLNQKMLRQMMNEKEILKDQYRWKIRNYSFISHYLFLQIKNEKHSYLIHIDANTLEIISYQPITDVFIGPFSCFGSIKTGNQVFTMLDPM